MGRQACAVTDIVIAYQENGQTHEATRTAEQLGGNDQ